MQLQRLTTVGFLSMALLGTACDDKTADSSAPGVDKAAEIAKEIKAEPAQAEAILKKHGMTEDQFETLMFEIAEDPKQAEAFASKVGS